MDAGMAIKLLSASAVSPKTLILWKADRPWKCSN